MITLSQGELIVKIFRGIKYVGKGGAVNDWACYSGSAGRTDDDIADYGDKLDSDDAKEIFPEVQNLYRR